MKLDRVFWTRVSVEGALIVFSVLLALFLNDAWTRSKEAAATKRQLASVRDEIQANRAVVADWLQRHQAIADRVARLRRAGDEREALIVDHQLLLGRVFGDSLLESMVRSTAWETAITTGLIRGFDHELVQPLTDVYGLQKEPVRTVNRIASLIFDRATHQEEQLPQTLVLFELLLGELRGQEQLLLESYDETLEIFEREFSGE